ncbi:MAG: CHASE2 domain-containing protein [Candidatus Acidiferrales bacterium]
MKSFSQRLLPLSLAAAWAVVATLLYPAGVFRGWEAPAYDWLMQQRRPEAPAPKILLIDFDDDSQRQLGWPIPRRGVADVVKAAAPQATLIGLDILLSEPRTPAEDAYMAEALAAAGNVVLVEQLPQGPLPAAFPLEEFRRAAYDVGFANLPLEADGVLRRAYLYLEAGKELRGSFSLRLASDLLGTTLEATEDRFRHRLGEISIHADREAPEAFWLRFYGPAGTFRHVPAWKVLKGVPEVSLAADVVLIGQSNFAARDLHTTPYFSYAQGEKLHGAIPGLEVQATALANLLTGTTVQSFPKLRVALVDLVTLVVILLVFAWWRPLRAAVVSLAWVAGLGGAALWSFNNHNLWLPFVHTMALVVATATGSWGYRYAQELRSRRQLMGLFERYVAPQVAQKIWTNRDQIVLAGERRAATVLFSDIRGFTEMSAQRPSAEVLQWLNEYFAVMVPEIQRHNGFLNKFMGDGLMAVFGVPLSRGQEQDARDAVAAALAMLEALAELNRQRHTKGMPPLGIGIGLHSGPLTAGTIGAAERSEYSVVGETVNMASRVETACRQLQKPLLITEATRELLGDRFATEPAGTATLKGFAEPVPLYTVRPPGEVTP